MTALQTSIWTDGACIGNPGPGGWAVLLKRGDVEKIVRGREHATTNGRMELLGAVMAVETLKPGRTATLYSDSRYVVDGANLYLPGWKANGWRKANKKPVTHIDLWERLDAAMAVRSVTIAWVKGHVGQPENERVDKIAEAEALRAKLAVQDSPGLAFGFDN